MEPHTASRSVHEALIQDESCCYIPPHHVSLDQIISDKLLGFDCICAVRNPLDMVVSRWKLGKSHNIPFAEWVSKTDQLKSKWGGLWKSCNIICWFENLQDDLNFVFQRDILIQHNIKHRTLKKEPWWSYYQPDTVQVVTDHFREYIQEFGYEYTWTGSTLICSVNKSARRKRLKKIGYGRH